MSNDALDVKVQPVPVDTLTTLADAALVARQATIKAGVEAYAESCKELEETLAQRQRILEVLRREHDNVILAQKLKFGDVVRVVCPTCKGSGQSPDDVTSGRVRGSAFEGRDLGSAPTLQDTRDKCKMCNGNRYVIYDRFKG